MNDREFDALLESAAPELPPDDVARDVTPWRRAIGNILGGSALCSITLNLLAMNYLLPAIGVILLYSRSLTLHLQRLLVLVPRLTGSMLIGAV